jgi:cytochrome d ubiquinol oxidase subunit II
MFSAMYTPFMLFLAFIIMRAVSIEFRSKEQMSWWRKMWDIIYSISSVMLAFLLGVVLGNVLQGLAIDEAKEYQGGAFFDLLNFYTIMVGITTVALFMTHGAIYLLMKTEGKLYERLKTLLTKGIIFFIVSFGITTLYTLIYLPHLSDTYKSDPLFFLVPVAAFLSIANIPRLASKGKYRIAFLFSALTMSLLLILVAIELYPTLLISTIDPANNITIYNAASSEKSLSIMLTIAAIGAPLVLAYTIFVYNTFKGKVVIDETSY